MADYYNLRGLDNRFQIISVLKTWQLVRNAEIYGESESFEDLLTFARQLAYQTNATIIIQCEDGREIVLEPVNTDTITLSTTVEI